MNHPTEHAAHDGVAAGSFFPDLVDVAAEWESGAGHFVSSPQVTALKAARCVLHQRGPEKKLPAAAPDEAAGLEVLPPNQTPTCTDSAKKA